MSSVDGYSEIAMQGVDAVGPELQPKKNENQMMMLYFVAVIVLGNFLMLNLFVSVIFENFLLQRCYRGGKLVPPCQLDLIEFEDRVLYDVSHAGSEVMKPRFPKLAKITRMKLYNLVVR